MRVIKVGRNPVNDVVVSDPRIITARCHHRVEFWYSMY